MQSTKQFGNWAENLIATYLRLTNFTILRHNYREFFGEIDIIARKQELIIFVEVKARRHQTDHMRALVGKIKQRKIALTAKNFLAQQPDYHAITARFDVALVIGSRMDYTIEYIQDAFQADE
jgi:putative endonuclease